MRSVCGQTDGRRPDTRTPCGSRLGAPALRWTRSTPVSCSRRRRAPRGAWHASGLRSAGGSQLSLLPSAQPLPGLQARRHGGQSRQPRSTAAHSRPQLRGHHWLLKATEVPPLFCPLMSTLPPSAAGGASSLLKHELASGEGRSCSQPARPAVGDQNIESHSNLRTTIYMQSGCLAACLCFGTTLRSRCVNRGHKPESILKEIH